MHGKWPKTVCDKNCDKSRMLSRHPRSIWYTHYFPGLLIYRFDSPLIFSNAEIFSDELRDLVREADPPVRTVVINCEMIHDMGTTAAD